MNYRTKFLLTILIIFGLLFSFSTFYSKGLFAQDASQAEELQKQIREYEAKIQDLQGQQQTLASTISYLDAKMTLTQKQIAQTELEIALLQKDIDDLSVKIGSLETSLYHLTDALISRVQQSYKSQKEDPLVLLLFTNGFTEFINQYKYMKTTREYTKQLMDVAETQKINFDLQKQEKEKKQKEIAVKKQLLESQKIQLLAQQNSKKRLLLETKNSEKVFQSKLAQARQEFEAIQSIVAGKGKETKVGDVKEGSKIASIIQGSSCNSSNSHLHFMVAKDGIAQNPFSYLKSIDYENCSGSSCGSNDGDAFNPSGGWRWPIEAKVKYSQGYGYTWAVQNTWVGRIYRSHNGIDILSTSSDSVSAVRDGVLYRGSYSGSGGCNLRYVRVEQSDGLSTFYLHINYML